MKTKKKNYRKIAKRFMYAYLLASAGYAVVTGTWLLLAWLAVWWLLTIWVLNKTFP